MTYHTVFSPCRQYRYVWQYQWSAGPQVQFIGVNPSTADENGPDPTVTRCIGFAKAWGYGGLVMTNLFAYRATDPKVMKRQEDPVGPENDTWLRRVYGDCALSVAAWGTNGAHRGAHHHVRALLPNLACLGLTKAGYPLHPLYLKSDLVPIAWETT